VENACTVGKQPKNERSSRERIRIRWFLTAGTVQETGLAP
jgi:hypothetical protein